MRKIFAFALGFSLLAGSSLLMAHQDTKMDSTSTKAKKHKKSKKSTMTSTSAHSTAAN
jgi:hypothetical protein